jgi:CHAD domain-containing protein
LSEFHKFVVDGSPDIELEELAIHLGLHETEAEELERRFFDTPDGRLHAMGATLEVRNPVEYPMMRSLVWMRGGHVLASGRVDASFAPGFAGTLPAGPAFDRLREVIEMRTLLPVVEVRSRLSVAAYLDSEEKTNARVMIDLPTLPDGRPLPAVLEVRSVRGYESETDRLLAHLDARDGFDATDLSTADFARSMLGAPPFVPSKFSVHVEVSASSAEVWVTVMQELHNAMIANFAGTVDDVDSEYLHDFRVAVRRTRSVLQEGRDVLDAGAREHFRAGFKWLGDITTPTRDADVHLLDYPHMLAALSPQYAAALAPLGELLLARQRACQTQLAIDLRSAQRAQLGAEWAEFLAGDGPWAGRSTDAADADRPAREVVASRIARAHSRLVRDGRSIDAQSPPVALHDLRKDAKRLRYLLECFGSLFPAEVLAVAVRPLKSLQDVLGEFQDTEVQAHALADFGRQLDDAGSSTETILAMGGAIEQLSVRSARARREFASRFSTFDGASVNDAYDLLTNASKKQRRKKKR